MREKRSWTWLGWLGSSTQPNASQSNDQGGGDSLIQRHDPSTLLTRRVVLESEVNSLTSKMRKIWTRYEGLAHEKQLEALDKLLKNFVVVCPSQDSVSTIFGDGQAFTITISVRLITDVESILITKPMQLKHSIAQGLYELFFTQKELGCEIIDALTIISERRLLLDLMTQTQLTSALIRLLDAFFNTPFTQFTSVSANISFQRVQEIYKNIAFLARRLVKISYTDLMNTDNVTTITNVIKKQEYPAENVEIKLIMISILRDIFERADVTLIEHVSKKKIVSSFLNTLKKVSETEFDLISYVIESLVIIVGRSTSATSTVILSEFNSNNGYQIMQDAILECEEEFTREPNKLRHVLKLTADLVFVGEKPLETEINFDSIKGNRIKNQSAFQALSNTFVRTKSEVVRREVIDNILFIFAEHPANYLSVYELGTVAWFIQYINDYAEETQVSVLKLLEYIVAGLNYVPHEELKSLVHLLNSEISPNLAHLILNQITKLLQFNVALKASFREAQIFQVLSHLLDSSFSSILFASHNAPHDKDWLPILLPKSVAVLMDMLDQSLDNIRSFREVGGVVVLQQMLLNDTYRDLILKVFQLIILQDTHSVDVSMLVEILQTAQSNISLKLSIFNALRKMLQMKESAKDAFREVGFVATISVIINTPWPGMGDMMEDDMASYDEEAVLQLFDALFSTLAVALHRHPKNKSLFVKLVGVSAVTEAFRVNGILRTDYAYRAFQCLLDLATERYQIESVIDDVNLVKFDKLVLVRNARLLNPHAVKFLLMLIPDMTMTYRVEVLKVIEFCTRLSPINLEALSSIGVTTHILDNYLQDLAETSSPVHGLVVRILEKLGCYRLTQIEWRRLLQLLQKKEYLVPVQNILIKAAKDGASSPFVEIEPGSSCYISSLNDKSWGSNLSGYTFSCWFSYNMPSRKDAELPKTNKLLFTLLSLMNEDKKSYLKVTLRENGQLSLKTATTTKAVTFSNYTFYPRRWYHIAVSHKKYRLQGSSVSLFVNGVHAETQKTSFVSYSYSGGSKMKGFFGANPRTTLAALKIGPSFLYEDAITQEVASALFVAGPDYRGYYQGNYIPAMHMLSEHLSSGYIKLLLNQPASDMSATSESEAENTLKVSAQKLATDKFVFSFNALSTALRDLELAQENAPLSGVFLESIHSDHGGPRALLQSMAYCCHPTSLSDEILNSDGLTIVLALIEKADTSELLYDGLSLLYNLMLDSRKIVNELERISAYDMVGTFLRKKGYLITEQIHDLMWNMVLMGSSNGRELVTNLKACSCLLLDFEIWRKTTPALQHLLFQKIISLLSISTNKRWNAIRLDKISIVPHLLSILQECPPIDIMQSIADVISAQLTEKMTVEHVNAIKEHLLFTLDAESFLCEKDSATKSVPINFVETRRNSMSGGLKYLGPSARKSKKGPRAAYLRLSCRNILLKALLEVVKSKSANLDKFYKAVDVKWFFQFINQKTHPVSATLALQLWCCVALYNPTNATNDRMFMLLKYGLIPYCNQFDIYQTLISLLLGRYARYSERIENFETLIKSNKTEHRVLFPQVLPIILNLAKYNFRNDYLPQYDNLHLHQYFNDVGKPDVGREKWKYLHIGLETESEFTVSSMLANQEEEMVFFSKSQLQEDLRQNLSRSIVQYLLTMHKISASFKAEIKKVEVLEDLVAVLFSNATTDQFNLLQSETAETEEQTVVEDKSTPLENNLDSTIFEDFNGTIVVLFSLLNEIITTEFCNNSKGVSIVDDILEACPRFVVQQQVNSFKSIVISNVINYYSDAEHLRQVSENQRLATSVANFALYVADMHRLDILPVTYYKLSMKFIVDVVLQLNALDGAARKSKSKMATMISQAFTNTSSTLTLSIKDLTIAFRALNKMVLHLMTLSEDEDLQLEILEKLLHHDWLLTVLDTTNRDQDFFTCLYYIMYMAYKSNNERICENALRCWRLILSAQKAQENTMLSILSYKTEKNESINLVDGLSLLLQTDTSIFKEWAQQHEWFGKFFESRLSMEYKKIFDEDRRNLRARKANLSQTTRSRSVSNAMKKERKNSESYAMIARDCKGEVTFIKDQGEANIKNKLEQDIIRYKYASDQWQALKRQLFMERAVWFNQDIIDNIIWELDYTEAPQRMRKKFEIYENDPPIWKRRRNSISSPSSPSDERVHDSGKHHYNVVDQFKKLEELQMSPNRNVVMKPATPLELEDITDSSADDLSDIPQSIDRVENTENSEITDNTTDIEDFQEDYDFLDEEMGEYFKIRKLLEPGENMTDSAMFNCLRITGLDGKKGLFVICKHNMYIIDNFAYTKDDKIIEIDGNHLMSTYWSGDVDTPSSPSSDTASDKSSSGGGPVGHPCIKIPISELHQVLKRRYLLRLTAIELFCADGRNYFVVCERHEMESIYDRIIASAGKKVNKTQSQKQMTLAWQKGEVSNFEYLMFLNTLAGRSYNDLTQYPVFPWVLQDYTSETLDLNNPAVYRNLSKPMGALTESREEQFRRRFIDWPEATGIPKFHYGTHYSSAGVVLHFLMRIEPFTSRSIDLQGGKFDHADRMFHSVADTWESAATDYSMSDVKELIPEFFYLPEFLINSNNVDFGKRQNETPINNVVLPPWANNDPFEFIRINRQALESDYVSENLHHWIDLIFGYKQRGKEAEDACNVFYYLTYEGAVDIDAIENEVDREATISQISNFGQTPHQLFTSPHPSRTSISKARGTPTAEQFVVSYKVPLEDKEVLSSSFETIQSYACTNADVFYMNLIMSGDLRSAVASLKNRVNKESMQTVGEIINYKNEKDIIVLPKNSTMWRPKCSKYFTFGHADRSLRICKVGDDHHNAKFVYEDLHSSQISCAQASDDGKLLILGGEDSVVSVWKLERPQQAGRNKKVHLQLQKRLCGHSDRIASIAVSTAFSIIVSGSDDMTCIVWDLNRLKFIRQLEQIAHPTLRPTEPTKQSISKVVINEQNGDIIICAGNRIDVWSINGALLTTVDTGRSAITAVCVSPSICPKWYENSFIVTGHEDGYLKFWTYDFTPRQQLASVIKSEQEDSVEYEPSAYGLSSSTGSLYCTCLSLKLSLTKHSHSGIITSLFVTKDQKRLYSGDDTGSVVRWATA